MPIPSFAPLRKLLLVVAALLLAVGCSLHKANKAFDEGRYDEAVAEYRAVLRSDPTNTKAPGLREHHAVALTLKQSAANVFFQQANLTRYRRLNQMQHLGCARDVAKFGYCGHMMKPSGWGQWRCRVEWYWFRQDRFLWGVIREKTVPPVRRNSHSMRFISTRSGSTGSRCQTLSILDSSSGREQIGRSFGERIRFLKRPHSIR